VRFLPKGITNKQIIFILFLGTTTYSTIYLPKVIATVSGRNSWLPIIVITIMYAIITLMIAKLNNAFQDKALFDYSEKIVGKLFSYIISYYYMLNFFVIYLLLNANLITSIKSNFLQKTPQFVIVLLTILLISYVSYKGITNIARLFVIIGILFLIVTVGLCIPMILEGYIYNIRPFFQASALGNIWEIFKVLVIPYGGIEILFFIPFTKLNKKAPKIAFYTMIFIGLFYVLIVESTIMLLGLNNTVLYHDSFIEAIKIVTIPVIERTDVFYLTFGLSSLFAGLIIVFTGIVEYASKLFPKIKRPKIIIIFGVILFITNIVLGNVKNIIQIYVIFTPYVVMISTIVIPITLFILAKVKNKIV